jgi:hypothetical protein
MSYNFQPMSEEELNKPDDLIADGIYNFEVIKSMRKTSRNGNPMAELHLKFWDKDGAVHTVTDYLVFSSVKFNIRKIKHFCDAVGLQDSFLKGELPEEFGGYAGKLSLVTQEGQEIPEDKLKGKRPGSKYPDKNVVEDYVMTDQGAVKYENSASKEHANAPFQDDSLPF